MLTFENAFVEHIEFTNKAFPKGTSKGALLHLQSEIKEVIEDIDSGAELKFRAIEFADALGCLLDAANRNGVTPKILLDAFYGKLQVNKGRTWQYNGDGSYRHVK